MAIADWAASMKTLAESVFGEPVYFTEPRQVSGSQVPHRLRITPPYTVISGPTDTYRSEGSTIFRRFTLRHVVSRGEGDALEAYARVEALSALVVGRGADVFVEGEAAIRIESVEPPDLEGSDNLFALEVTLSQDLEI